MAGIRLDDFLGKKKDATQILDLSKCVARTPEELQKLLAKVPEFKSKPEKIRPDDARCREKDWSFRTPKREMKPDPPYTFMDPVPAEVRNVPLADLIGVDIDWRMLTTSRPRSRLEEEFFSRLVLLGKVSRATLQRERNLCGLRGAAFSWSCAAGGVGAGSGVGVGGCASARWVRRRRGHSATPTEARPVCCLECGDEMCDSSACRLHTYESFLRSDAVPITTRSMPAAVSTGGGRKRSRRRSKSATGGRGRPHGKGRGLHSQNSTSSSRGKSATTRQRSTSRHRSASAPPAPKSTSQTRSSAKAASKKKKNSATRPRTHK